MVTNDLDRWYYEHQPNNGAHSVEDLRIQFEKASRVYKSMIGEYLPRNQSGLILDMPCGEGSFIYFLTKTGFNNAKGFDLDEQRIVVGRKLGLPVYVEDVQQVLDNQDDSSVQCIVSMNFIEHIEKIEAVNWIQKVFNKLKPGGVFIITTPSADSPFGNSHIYNDLTHKWAATSSVVQQIFTNCGFSNVRVFGFHPRPGMRFGLIRCVLFWITTKVINLCLLPLGHSYKIWSPSMWAVAVKS